MNYNETVEAVNAVLARYRMPLTLRQVYYQLVVGQFIPNRRSAYNGLSAQLVTARERGEVDEDRIVDRHRSINDRAFDSPNAFFDAVIATCRYRYVRRYWTTQPVYVETWVEKDALAQIISESVEELNTVVAPCKGYSSFSYIKEALARFDKTIQDSSNDGRVIILYMGDHDPSGLDMTRDLQSRFRQYGLDKPFEVTVKRIALNYDQVEQYNLVPSPTKIQDSRAAAYMEKYGGECWELDALDPRRLIELVREAVEEQIEDPDAWDELKAQDEAERKRIQVKIEQMKKDFK